MKLASTDPSALSTGATHRMAAKGRPPGFTPGYKGSTVRLSKGISKGTLPLLIQRLIPSVSRAQAQYGALMVDSAAPHLTVITWHEFLGAVKHAAAVEKAVESGQVPDDVRAVLDTLASAFPVGRKHEELHMAFRRLDESRTGTLSSANVVQLLVGALGSGSGMERRSAAVRQLIGPREILWLAAKLEWFCNQNSGHYQGPIGLFTFEEMMEALVWLGNASHHGDLDARGGVMNLGWAPQVHTGQMTVPLTYPTNMTQKGHVYPPTSQPHGSRSPTHW